MEINKPILFGFLMAAIDVFILSLLKMRYSLTISNNLVFIIAFFIYGIQPFIFYYSLKYANLSRMNLIWDLMSDLLVTTIAIIYFREFLTNKQYWGVIFGIIAIFLLK